MRVLVILLLLTACVDPRVIEAQETQYCASLGAPKGSDKYYDCRVRLMQQKTAQQQQFAASMSQFSAQQQAHQQQEHMNAVWAANPGFAACRYNGQCGAYQQPQRVHTTCENRFGRLECNSY